MVVNLSQANICHSHQGRRTGLPWLAAIQGAGDRPMPEVHEACGLDMDGMYADLGNKLRNIHSRAFQISQAVPLDPCRSNAQYSP